MDQNNKIGKLLPTNPETGPSRPESSTNVKTGPKPETTKDNLQYK